METTAVAAKNTDQRCIELVLAAHMITRATEGLAGNVFESVLDAMWHGLQGSWKRIYEPLLEKRRKKEYEFVVHFAVRNTGIRKNEIFLV